MPDLKLTDIPEDLYKHLHEFARQDKRSIREETIVLLRSALNHRKSRMKRFNQLVEEARSLNIDPDDQLLDPVELIREHRDR